MDEALRAKISKIKALAERGVGGEKETAERKLAKLLADNGLTEADLFEDTVNYYLFSYTSAYKSKLLGQIIYKVTGDTTMYHTKGTRNKIGVYCTAAQKIEIELDFEFYSNLFDVEVAALLDGFIIKQNIYPADCPTTVVKEDDLTPEELENIRKRNAYAETITHRARTAMIEDKQ